MKDEFSSERFSELVNSIDRLSPILVLGDVGIDKYTYGDVRRISPEAPVPVVEVKREWLKLGLAANISHNLKTMGLDSLLCGVIGSDLNATRFESLLEESGLKIWGIVRSHSRPTIYKERITTDTQQICRVDYETTSTIDTEIQQKLVARIDEFSADHQALIIEDYAKGTLNEELIQAAIGKFKKAKKLVCVDPGTTTPPRFYRGATLLKPNLKEARLMSRALGLESEEINDIGPFLVEQLDLEMLAVTLGPEGMAIIDRKNSLDLEIVPTMPTEVYDVSGAGDTAISLLCVSLAAGATLKEAAIIANCGSGVVVGKKGTATVNREELEGFFHRYRQALNL